MQTSYFAKYKEDNAVSISLSTPKWFTGKSYKKLAPSWNLLNGYKEGRITEKDYKVIYTREVLDRLNAQQVYNELVELAGEDAVLLCWEKSSDFCHRHLVADWLHSELGIDVNEYVKE
jgi:uncharacterized protein (DUF488 family)